MSIPIVVFSFFSKDPAKRKAFEEVMKMAKTLDLGAKKQDTSTTPDVPDAEPVPEPDVSADPTQPADSEVHTEL
jgi:hypothetical protein